MILACSSPSKIPVGALPIAQSAVTCDSLCCRYAAQTFVMLQLIGTGIAQIIACSTDYYSIDKSYSKR